MLEMIALTCGDEEFASTVVKEDPKAKKTSTDDTEPVDDDEDVGPEDELAKLILESMDKDELTDFKDILKNVQTKGKNLKKKMGIVTEKACGSKAEERSGKGQGKRKGQRKRQGK